MRKDYGFSVSFDERGYPTLTYEAMREFHWDAVTEPWADEWPKAMSYDQFLRDRHLEDDDCECCGRKGHTRQQYKKYADQLNPVLHRAADGHPKYGGQYGGTISRLPPCPDHIAVRVRELLSIRAMSSTVVWNSKAITKKAGTKS